MDRVLILTWNFSGGPSDSASTFFKMANSVENFFYEDDFNVVITIIDC